MPHIAIVEDESLIRASYLMREAELVLGDATITSHVKRIREKFHRSGIGLRCHRGHARRRLSVEAVSRRIWLTLILCAFAALAQAAGKDDDVLARGARDGNVSAWAIAVVTPTGWTRDCCTYARAIGVNAVLYQGEWSGTPQRVMVLNVWPRKLPSLAAEVTADRARYLQLDPAGKTSSFTVRHRSMPCTASVYEGSDHVDDVLVFCDPGRITGIRLSWSMTLDANDPAQRALMDDFMRVVVGTRYRRGE